MATGTTTRKRATRNLQKKAVVSEQPATTSVKVRMYRQGLGDCFLLTLPRSDDKPFYIMIDCGVILGTADATRKMRQVVTDISNYTQGHIDLLIATHEHWDHLSGFVQAKDLFERLEIDRVWMGWTEDPEDQVAQKIRSERQAMRLALTSASARMRLDGDGGALVDGMLEFFGAAGQGTTADALEVVRTLSQKSGGQRYCRPNDEPVPLDGTGVRAFFLGPPSDEAALKKVGPSRSDPETYGLPATFLNRLTPALGDTDQGAPFDPIRQIPLDVARQMPFFG
jgi:hypothetical protein